MKPEKGRRSGGVPSTFGRSTESTKRRDCAEEGKNHVFRKGGMISVGQPGERDTRIDYCKFCSDGRRMVPIGNPRPPEKRPETFQEWFAKQK